MEKLLLIAAGGAVGAVLRYLMGGWIQLISDDFWLGTLSVNVLGCLLIGVFATAFTGPFLVAEELRLALIIGVFGGFTTFSSFGWETVTLLEDGQWSQAMAYIGLSNVLGIAAVLLGRRMVIWLFGVS